MLPLLVHRNQTNSCHQKDNHYPMNYYLHHMLVEVDYPGKGKVPIPGPVIKLSKTPGQVPRRSPLLGEHNEEILSELLQYTSDDIIRLQSEGIV